MAPFPSLAPHTQFTLESSRLNRGLRALGVEIVTEHVLTGVADGAATSMSVWDERMHEWPADGTVLVTQRRSDDALFRALDSDRERLAAAGIVALHQIGDCYAPGLIAESIFSGHRLAREIDSPNPAVALPFVRERRIVGSSEDDYRLDGSAIHDLEETSVG